MGVKAFLVGMSFFEVGMLSQNGLIAAQPRVYAEKFHKKSALFSGLGLYSREGMPPAHITSARQRAGQHMCISCQIRQIHSVY